VDEAGRGPLAGPVVAAAVVLKDERFKNRIDDSKKLTPSERERAFQEITKNALYGTGIISEKIIDKINIVNSTRFAMQRAVRELLIRLEKDPCFSRYYNNNKIYVIIDGKLGVDIGLPFKEIIGGDRKSLTIAAASIVAKVIRDRIMLIYDKIFPDYGFLDHKGYATVQHIRKLKKIGPSPIHRMSFQV